jgi:hypothetical protein
VSLSQDSITPCRDTSFVTTVVLVCTDIVLVRRQKGDSGFVIVWECLAMDHLKIEL